MSPENLELEQQRRKLETLGRLTANVVHDFNNILMVINGYTRMLLEEPRLSESAQESAVEILRASERASALTGQLLAFSKKKSVELHPLDLNAQLRQMRAMLGRLLGGSVQLDYKLNSDACTIFANHSKLEQLVLNLIVNARDAMPMGGQIVVATTVNNGRVYLTVEDNGVGMDQTLLPRIFEPFFTTKDATTGTGIGLALVHEIIQEWGGLIRVESTVQVGTSFHIDLPLYDPETAQTHTPPAPQSRLATILLVEDEDSVRALIRRILEQRHYQVLEAATEEGGLAIARNHAGIDLLLTDLELKEGDGRSLSKLVCEIHPAIKILYISGYLHDFTNESSVILQKPFSLNTLVLAVQGLLKSDRTLSEVDSL